MVLQWLHTVCTNCLIMCIPIGKKSKLLFAIILKVRNIDDVLNIKIIMLPSMYLNIGYWYYTIFFATDVRNKIGDSNFSLKSEYHSIVAPLELISSILK